MCLMGCCKFYFHHTRKEISMKKCLIALFLLFGTVAFAKTWEANLRSCDGYGGFWFPNHNWTDKGEPWIKPFMKGKILEDYNEMGLSFNYDEPEGVCTPPPCLTVENPIGLTYTPPASGKTMLLMDSVYFFETNCENDYATGGGACDKYLSLENFSMDDFVLVKIDSLNYYSFYNIDYLYNRMTGIYFIYKKYSNRFEYSALCNMVKYKIDDGDFYEVQCEFQDDGTLNFDKLPDVKNISENFCSTHSIVINSSARFKQKNNFAKQLLYKVNGMPVFKGSSNIIIKNKQPKLQLKEH